MNVAGVISAFRSRVSDLAQPYLWSDAEAIQYLDEAQMQYCRDVRGVADSTTPAVTVLAVTAGTADFKLDDRVLQLRSVYSTTQRRELTPVEVLDRRRRTETGVPLRYTLGETDGYLSLDCIPAASDTLLLTVYRLPLLRITDTNSVLEAPPQHHIELVAWMEHLAYMKQDVDTYDKRKSDDAANRFALFCKAAKHELSRKRHTPRAVRYGGL